MNNLTLLVEETVIIPDQSTQNFDIVTSLLTVTAALVFEPTVTLQIRAIVSGHFILPVYCSIMFYSFIGISIDHC